MPKRILKHAGNRGVALAMLGALWVLMGVGAIVAPAHHPPLIDDWIPVWARACLWGVPGVLALVASMQKKLDADAWGWLIVPVLVRFVSFTVGWVCSLLGVESYAYPDGWRGATTIAIFLVFIKACAGGLDRCPPVKREA